MAVLEVKVPQLSESVTEATLLQWHKKEGEAVALDENLVDIETDKVVLELPCPANGVLVSILKKDGSIVVAGEVIATVDTEAKASATPVPATPQTREMELFASAPAAEPVAVSVSARAVPVDPPARLEKEEDSEIAAFDSERDMPDPADYPSGIVMPAAARMMAELGMDETSVVGTGKDGRITKKDVERAWEAKEPISLKTKRPSSRPHAAWRLRPVRLTRHPVQPGSRRYTGRRTARKTVSR